MGEEFVTADDSLRDSEEDPLITQCIALVLATTAGIMYNISQLHLSRHSALLKLLPRGKTPDLVVFVEDDIIAVTPSF